MMTRGSSFSQRGGGFLVKTYTHADIFFFFCEQTAASYDLDVFLPLKTSVWAFRICLHCQIQKHLENQRSIKETLLFCPVPSSWSSEQALWTKGTLRGYGVHGEPFSFREKKLQDCEGSLALLQGLAVVNRCTKFAVSCERTQSESLES